LLLITFRPEFTAPWIGRPHVTSLTLYRLPRRQAAEMIVYVTGGKADATWLRREREDAEVSDLLRLNAPRTLASN
jgi:hypothetical protein